MATNSAGLRPGTTVEELCGLSAAEAARRIADGTVTAQEMVSACLARIREREPEVQAWEYLDEDYALGQARRLDDWRAAGHEIGPLHGVPVAVKDIIDTRDMPTCNGTPLHEGRRTRSDAAIVAQLRQAGAVILGKTVTAELAVYAPGKTRNPHDPGRTPGGSSSGSAAAVAAGMVPLAVGTQTAGSIIRPASYCGVFGFKPTHGAISRTGVLTQAPPLDTVGPFARTVEDLALLTDAMSAYDEKDPDMRPHSRGSLRRTATSTPAAQPVIAFVKTPVWEEHAEPATKEAYAELTEALAEQCDTVDLPDVFQRAWAWQRMLQMAGVAKNYGPLVDRAPEQASEIMRELIAEGREVTAVDYNTALEMRQVLNAGLDEIFKRYDAILTPATPGPAPKGLESTGSPVFNALWTYCGVPCVNLPLLDVDGMPLGVQLVGRRQDDGRLLRTANWLVQHLAALAEG
ncbi:amidase [Dichotomicrobium thermohalophilum]|uniref:Asp-tRNA(Asn)/Glu-tRNA(Gln) amidotransferase A subunit family amidase n=1 Tax=Dichotomicrobium thermohalophilum TaxID=933063 RepID=A0A397Q780_9HYPH|nr:amidase [Dichotomicrobium thermohalophilum]RIA56908.1 Asp-tRNA(Asn)/Glu-tRNA(Gln) amidotransferase A subunit family amidase [Dichotomicrobium thermohalophilum]